MKVGRLPLSSFNAMLQSQLSDIDSVHLIYNTYMTAEDEATMPPLSKVVMFGPHNVTSQVSYILTATISCLTVTSSSFVLPSASVW